MAENLTLARPYAEAAFALARSGDGLPSWSNAIQRISSISSRPEMRECIGNPRFSPTQVASLCLDVAGGGLTTDQQNFVRLLVDNGRLDVLPEVAALYEDLRNAHEGIRDAEVSSALPLGDAALAELVAGLEKRFECRIRASVRIDPELIGGVRIAIGDEVIDASVRGKLAAMATALRS